MSSTRLEAFSDGVLAIIITIMVLELRVPHGESLGTLRPLVPILLSYVLSFAFVGVYWNNHHHLMQAVENVNGSILWANLHLLFWLSLIPFVTGWMGENHFAALPVAAYGVILLMSSVAYLLLARRLISQHGPESALAVALGKDHKEAISMGLYAIAIPLAFFSRWIALGIYVVVAGMWIVPDRRIEETLPEVEKSS